MIKKENKKAERKIFFHPEKIHNFSMIFQHCLTNKKTIIIKIHPKQKGGISPLSLAYFN